MCKVLNKHVVGMPTGAIYIGRGSRWGNPFRIGPDANRADVVAKHEAWLRGRHDLLRAIGDTRELRQKLSICLPAEYFEAAGGADRWLGSWRRIGASRRRGG